MQDLPIQAPEESTSPGSPLLALSCSAPPLTYPPCLAASSLRLGCCGPWPVCKMARPMAGLGGLQSFGFTNVVCAICQWGTDEALGSGSAVDSHAQRALPVWHNLSLCDICLVAPARKKSIDLDNGNCLPVAVGHCTGRTKTILENGCGELTKHHIDWSEHGILSPAQASSRPKLSAAPYLFAFWRFINWAGMRGMPLYACFEIHRRLMTEFSMTCHGGS